MKIFLYFFLITVLVVSCAKAPPVKDTRTLIPETNQVGQNKTTQDENRTTAGTSMPTELNTINASSAGTATPTLRHSGTRTTKYYGVDRVDPKDINTLSPYHINTVITAFDVNESQAKWRSFFAEAEKYNVGVVVIPTDWDDPRPDCDWGAAYPVNPEQGDYIKKIKPMFDFMANQPQFIGVVNAHEALWTSCSMTIDEMATIKNQVKNYVKSEFGRDIQVWNYIGNIDYYINHNQLAIGDIPNIMDVAITWKHCIADAEGPCLGDADINSAIYQIRHDRTRIDQANDATASHVELVFLFQTFSYIYSPSSPYSRMPTLEEMNTYGCAFLGTDALDGFFWYTWAADWYTINLDDDVTLWPAMNTVYDGCVIKN